MNGGLMQLKKQKSIHVWHVMYVGFACVLRMKWIVQTCLEISVTDCGRDLERETIVQGRRTWGLLQQGIWHVTLPLSRGAICCYNHMNVCKTPRHTNATPMPRPFTQLRKVYKHLISTRISQLSQTYTFALQDPRMRSWRQLFYICGTVHHHSINKNNQRDAACSIRLYYALW